MFPLRLTLPQADPSTHALIPTATPHEPGRFWPTFEFVHRLLDRLFRHNQAFDEALRVNEEGHQTEGRHE